MVQVHLLIRGRVQGVWYRQSTLAMARSMGLAGWVRNLPTGEVEALIEGEADVVEQMVSWCRQGPPAAQVSGLDTEHLTPEGLTPPFQILETR